MADNIQFTTPEHDCIATSIDVTISITLRRERRSATDHYKSSAIEGAGGGFPVFVRSTEIFDAQKNGDRLPSTPTFENRQCLNFRNPCSKTLGHRKSRESISSGLSGTARCPVHLAVPDSPEWSRVQSPAESKGVPPWTLRADPPPVPARVPRGAPARCSHA